MDTIWHIVILPLQWLIGGFIAAVSSPMYWGGLVVGTGGGWILGRGWPREDPPSVQDAEWDDEDDWDDDWDDDGGDQDEDSG
jgi:hypothetical protein